MNFLNDSQCTEQTIDNETELYDAETDCDSLEDNYETIEREKIQEYLGGEGYTVDCLTDFTEMPTELLELLKDSTHVESDEEVTEKIVDFMTEQNIDTKEYDGFPDCFKKFMLQASKDRFKVLLSESDLLDDVDHFL
jgi:hypothetical protein